MQIIPVNPEQAAIRVNAHASFGTKLANAKSEKNYEATLAKLGLHVLQSRVADLMPYFRGFQLLKMSDDGEFAAGFFVFQMNNMIVDAPMFMLKGQLKGKELLFFRNRQAFLPARESLIKYMIGIQEQTLGDGLVSEGEHRPLRASPNVDVFSQANRFMSKVSHYIADQSPWGRTAQVLESHNDIYQDPKTAAILGEIKEGRLPSPDLKGLLVLPGMCEKLAEMCRKSPKLAKKVNERFGPNLHNEVVAARETGSKLASMPLRLRPLASGPQLVRPASSQPLAKLAACTTVPKYLDGAEREAAIAELCEFGAYFIDRRDDIETKTAMEPTAQPQIRDKEMLTPVVSGEYRVPTLSGDLKDAVVFLPADVCDFSAMCQKNDKPLAYALSKSGEGVATPTSELLISVESQDDPVTLKEKWIESLPTFGSASLSRDDRFCLIDSYGRISSPFVYRETTGEDSHAVYSATIAVRGGSLREEPRTQRDRERLSESRQKKRIGSLQVAAKGSGFTRVAAGNDMDALVIPKTAKVFKLAGSQDEADVFPLMVQSAMSDEHFLKLASFHVAQTGLKQYTIDNQKYTPKRAAMHLMSAKGMNKTAALDLLRKVGKRQQFVTIPTGVHLEAWQLGTELGQKIAAFQPPGRPNYQYSFPDQGRGASDTVIPVDEQYGVETYEAAPMEYADRSSQSWSGQNDAYAQPQESGNPSMGSGGGQGGGPGSGGSASAETLLWENQLFESLIRTNRLDNQLSKQLEGLYKLADTSGRTLFLLYAHQDIFEERFGEKDVPLLEEQLLTLFEAAGDTIVDLLQRSVDSSNDTMLMTAEEL